MVLSGKKSPRAFGLILAIAFSTAVLAFSSEAHSACPYCCFGTLYESCDCRTVSLTVEPGTINACNKSATAVFTSGCCACFDSWGPVVPEAPAGPPDPAVQALTGTSGYPDGGPGAAILIKTDGPSLTIYLDKPELVTSSFRLKITAHVSKIPALYWSECLSCEGKPDDYVTYLNVEGSGNSDCAGGGPGGCKNGCSSGQKAFGDADVVLAYPRVRVNMSLGKVAGGQTPGELCMELGDLPTGWTLTGAHLGVTGGPDVQDSGNVGLPGYVRWISVPQGSALIMDDTDANGSKFTVSFFTHQRPYPTYGPFRTWTFRNPNMTWSGDNGVPVKVRVEDDLSGVYTDLTPAPAGAHGWVTHRVKDTAVATRRQLDNGQNPPTTTCEVEDESTNKVSTVTQYNTFDGWAGPRIASVQTSINGQGTQTTTYQYAASVSQYDANLQANVTGPRMTISRPDGSWVVYQYDTAMRKRMETGPFLSSPSTDPNAGHVVVYDYDDSHQIDDGTCRAGEPRTVTEVIAGQIASKTYHCYSGSEANGWQEIEKRDPNPLDSNGYGSSDNLTTTTYFFGYGGEVYLGRQGRPSQIEYPDGRITHYEYQWGTFTAGAPFELGSFAVGGTDLCVTNWGYQQPTYQQTIADSAGKLLWTGEYVPNGPWVDWTKYTYQETGYGDRGQLQHEYHLNRTQRDFVWNDCCGLYSETDTSGIETRYDPPDVFGRITGKSKTGLGATPAPYMWWSYAYDLAGHVTSESVTDGTQTLTTNRTYRPDGRIESSTEAVGAANLTTWYEYDDVFADDDAEDEDEDGRKVMVTRPGGGDGDHRIPS